jgi:hypothetical protein
MFMPVSSYLVMSLRFVVSAARRKRHKISASCVLILAPANRSRLADSSHCLLARQFYCEGVSDIELAEQVKKAPKPACILGFVVKGGIGPFCTFLDSNRPKPLYVCTKN